MARTEREILAEFSDKRTKLNQTWTKMTELSADSTEHELVIAALQPMDPERKCFRLIGDVLVERTVGETLPAVEKTRANLDLMIASLSTQLQQQKEELTEYQAKYKIKIRENEGEEQEAADGEDAVEPSQPKRVEAGRQGVLVHDQ
ncbi:MAG: hypothetical protein WDW38_004943 [Sanguina aurantia]